LSFADIFGIRKLEFPSCGVIHDPAFSRFSRQTDGERHTRRQLIPALASVARVKIALYPSVL